MNNITTLDALYKRDSKGKLRIWEIQWGYSDDSAGTRTISGLVDGKKVTSGWNLSELLLLKRSQRLNHSGILKQRKNTLMMFFW